MNIQYFLGLFYGVGYLDWWLEATCQKKCTTVAFSVGNSMEITSLERFDAKVSPNKLSVIR